MWSAAFKAARHEETLEAAAAVIAGIDKALVSQGTGHIHRQAAIERHPAAPCTTEQKVLVRH